MLIKKQKLFKELNVAVKNYFKRYKNINSSNFLANVPTKRNDNKKLENVATKS